MRQIVVIATEPCGEFHEAATGEVDGVVADTQRLNFGKARQVACVVVESTDIRRSVHQVVIVATEARGQFHKATASEVDGVVADAQHLHLFHQVMA